MGWNEKLIFSPAVFKENSLFCPVGRPPDPSPKPSSCKLLALPLQQKKSFSQRQGVFSEVPQRPQNLSEPLRPQRPLFLLPLWGKKTITRLTCVPGLSAGFSSCPFASQTQEKKQKMAGIGLFFSLRASQVARNSGDIPVRPSSFFLSCIKRSGRSGVSEPMVCQTYGSHAGGPLTKTTAITKTMKTTKTTQTATNKDFSAGLAEITGITDMTKTTGTWGANHGFPKQRG